MSKNKTILMCPPKYFDIEYEINPWMHRDDPVNHDQAAKQWQKLFEIYTQQLGWHVETIESVKGLPDMVFTTDICLILNDKVMLSNFRHPQRRLETEHLERWLREHGYNDIKKAANFLEGGDMLVFGDKIIAGHGFRSDLAAHHEMREYFGCEVISLKIVDPDYYHLDTSVTVLSKDTVAFYPSAIDRESQEHLRTAVPNIIEASLEEAQGFGLNTVSDGTNIVVCSDESESLLQKYRDVGFNVIGTSILEFRKSGGGVKCLTLELS